MKHYQTITQRIRNLTRTIRELQASEVSPATIESYKEQLEVAKVEEEKGTFNFNFAVVEGSQ